MPIERERELEDRAAALGVYVSTVKRSKGGWVVRVFTEGHRNLVELRGKGPLEAVVAGALDDWQEIYGWTASELLSIAVASGLPVSRG